MIEDERIDYLEGRLAQAESSLAAMREQLETVKEALAELSNDQSLSDATRNGLAYKTQALG